MLIGIDPLLRGELLAALQSMGHGDVLVVADANFPVHRLAAHVIDLAGVDAPHAMRAIASVFPIDPSEAISLMLSPSGRLPVQDELVMAASASGSPAVVDLERFEFYAAARSASLVVRTGEMRSYGSLMALKGTVS